MKTMHASPGDRINQYVVERLIAVGGSACVYQARDPLIGRWVAIKILLEPHHSLSNSADPALEEARACSSFSHQNAVTVYEVGEHHGLPFLVTEWLDGITLQERLLRGPLESKLALEVFRQVASVLAEAHVNGLVHRDLKPSNIMVDARNQAKVLDFGIASGPRLFAGSDASHRPSPSGTPGYISPEQAQGQTATPAADVYSFGCVLFEALNGQPYGEEQADEIPETKTRTTNDPVGRRLLKLATNCLQVAPGDRPPNGAALFSQLDAVTTRTKTIARCFSPPAIVGAIGAVLAVLLLGMALNSSHWPRPRHANPQRGIEQLSVEGNLPTLLGDDTTVAYVTAGGHEIWSTPIGVGTTHKRWAGPLTIQSLAAIPKDTSIIFSAAEPDRSPWIWELPSGEHLARKIIRGTSPAVSEDGSFIVVIQETANSVYSLVICRRDGTDCRVLHTFRGSTIPISCAFLPDTKSLAVVATDTVRHSWLLKIDLHDGASSVIFESMGIAFRGIAVADDPPRVIWSLRNQAAEEAHLMVTPLDRPGVQLVYPGPGRSTYPSLSSDRGLLTFQTQEASKTLIEIVVQPGAHPAGAGYVELANTSGAGQPRVSPDGSKIAYCSAQGTLWVLDRSTGLAGPLLTTGVSAFNPSWSPSGEYIAYSCIKDSLSDIWIAGSDGRQPERLTGGVGNSFQPVWHPDGETILFISDREGQEDLFAIGIADGSIWRLGNYGATNPAISPDGRHVAYLVGAYGPQPRLRLSRLTDDARTLEMEWERAVRVDRWGGAKPRFSPGGGWLAFDQSRPDSGADIWAVRVTGPSDSAAVRLTHLPRPMCLLGWFDWGPDGHIVMCAASVRHRIQVLHDAEAWITRALD